MAITKDTTTLPGQTIVTDSAGGVAIDYSSYYDRIATALETIAVQATTVATNSTSITNSLGTDSTDLASIFSNISLDINALKTLAAGVGIKTNDPLAWMGFMSIYKLYVEDPDAIGLDALKAYKAKIDELIASLAE